MALTEKEIEELEGWLKQQSVANMPVEQPVVTSVTFLGQSTTQGGSPLGEAPRLSQSTRKAYAKRAAKAEQKKRGAAASAKRLPRGKYSVARKRASKLLEKKQRWRRQPLKCLSYGYGYWTITQEEWDEHIGPLWSAYEPCDLVVKKYAKRGTREAPYRIYDIRVEHRKRKKRGKPRVLFDGRQLLWEHACQPNALDIEKAPEGALLFEKPVWLTKEKLEAVGKREAAKRQLAYLQERMDKLSATL